MTRLAEAGRAPLVLLNAPAGFSKSTCLAEWAQADARPFAWLSVSPRHDDPALLVAAVVEALNQIEPVEPEVLAPLSVPTPDIFTVALPRLGRSLRARSEPFVLAVDDVHAISSATSFEVFETLIGMLPPGSQLALASRTEPPLALGRFRANRQLCEITQSELALTRAESGELLANLGLELSEPQVSLLFERTEGWAAALCLAGTSLENQPDISAAVSSFAGDDRIVVDYLRDEFLAATSPARLRFLTRSSILDELSGPVCDAVLEQSGSARLLRDVARSNSLLIPMDRTDERFRFHHLFAEMLRSELRRREPELEEELHARASRWYAAHSDPDRAIDHATAAGDIDAAGSLIWGVFPEMSGRGRLATVERWLDTIGDDGIAACAPLSLTCAHRHLALGHGDRAAHWTRVAKSVADSSAGESQSIQADVHLLDATLAADGVSRMGAAAARASELFPYESPWQAPCLLYQGVSRHLSGAGDLAVPLLQEAASRGAVASPLIQVLALGQLCLLAAQEGDWDRASRLAAQGRDQVARCGLADYPSMLMIHACSALVRAHEGRVERAQEDFAHAKLLLKRMTDFPAWYEAEAMLTLSRVAVRFHDLEGARSLLDDASRFIDRIPDPGILPAWRDESAAHLEAASSENGGRDWSLTMAELRILQYLPTHLSFREIGERIHISPNTVKTQAQAVYRKLDVSSRAEAVERAEKAGLLGEDP